MLVFRVKGVAPVALPVDLQAAVAARVRAGPEGRLAGVDIGDAQSPACRQDLVLNGFARRVAGDGRQVVGAGDTDPDLPGSGAVGGGNREGFGNGFSLAQGLDIGGPVIEIVHPVPVLLDGERSVGSRLCCTLKAGLPAVGIGNGKHAGG